MYQRGGENLGTRSCHNNEMNFHKNNHTSITLFHHSFFSHAPTYTIQKLLPDYYIPPLSFSLSLPIYIHTSIKSILNYKIDMEVLDSRKLQLQQPHNLKEEQHFHVLAVDDSVIDRKLLERLLRDSSCKGRLLRRPSKRRARRSITQDLTLFYD